MKSLFSPKPYESIITIPNIITSAGLALIGIYVYGFLVSSRWILMTSVFLSGCSDLLDGETARRLQQKTRLGEFLDPLRDRLLLLAVLANIFYITDFRLLILWGGFIVGFEVLMVLNNLFLIAPRNRKVHIVGKLRQAAHLLLAGFVILSFYFRDIIFGITNINFNFPPTLALPLMAFCSCVAFICYIWRAAGIEKPQE
ncbi:MAG: hypothetical protein CO014_00680 [Candidatus Tagabacteria bacterium CG_4_8_14_3_um_filter_41_8]|uniref:CDP-diacylglycerol--glycerol-3-phosphate 3-phosphatidyltransferase n=1 Tax=Candidatus Tagabacteria bacterium CG_4_8_14_3_um_filter_41_8 TaxID=1975018 RepID=A0A2M8G9A3_9BACT|nr:MAG: hypothetical protein CO014_00680 [Candidatus Tagabacteria bacterium CG_4_8_14_3_um_filter_41_8]